MSDLPKYYRLNKYGVEVQGTVILKEPEQHQRIEVQYEVNNNKLKAGGGAGDFDKDFSSVKLQEKVPVYYNPEYPEESCLGNPSKHLDSSLIEICVISFIPFLLFISYILKKISSEKTAT